MTAYQWMTALAAGAGLLLAALAMSRGARGPLAIPLALLALDQFAWNVGTLGYFAGGDAGWRWLAALTAPFFPPFAFHFVLGFVGQLDARRRLLQGVYAVYAAQSVLGLGLYLAGPAWPPDPFAALSALHLLTDVPLTVFAAALLVRHHRRAADPLERGRTRALAAALAVFVGFVLTDLLSDMGVKVVGLANVGSFAFNAVLATVAFRMRLFEERGTAASAWVTLLAVLLGVTGYLAVFTVVKGRVGLLIVGLGVVTLGVVVLVRSALLRWSAEHAGLERLALMGRFSAQMAHDLKNPLAAARGAAQYLEEELRQGRPIDGQKEFVGLVLEQLDRLGRVIERYQRIGRVQPEWSALDAATLVNGVLALQRFAATTEVAVQKELPASPLGFEGDADLLASALENLVKNAFEAMPKGGTLQVGARPLAEAVEFWVKDTGQGMDPRTRESAGTLFQTTKASGSGLGLNFVRQVVAAHGGAMHLDTAPGLGTTITFSVPLRRPAAAG